MAETPTQADIPQHASLEECERCHETIWRWKEGEREVAVEFASRSGHDCWQALPEGADFISTD